VKKVSEYSDFYSTRETEMKHKAVNMTNHKLDIMLKNRSMFQYKTEAGLSLKLNKITREVCKVDAGIPLVQNVFLHDANLMPPVQKGVFYIVPKLVAELYKEERSDFIYPGTNPSEDGAIITNGRITTVKRFRLPNVLSINDEVIEMI